MVETIIRNIRYKIKDKEDYYNSIVRNVEELLNDNSLIKKTFEGGDGVFLKETSFYNSENYLKAYVEGFYVRDSNEEDLLVEFHNLEMSRIFEFDNYLDDHNFEYSVEEN